MVPDHHPPYMIGRSLTTTRQLLAHRRSVRRLVPRGSRAWDSDGAVLQYRTVCSLLNKHVPSGSAVLDWGAGPGDFSAYLLLQHYKVSACEFFPPPDREALESFAPGLYDFTLLEQGDSLPYPDAVFDAVLSLGVLEHVREGGTAEDLSLAELNRVLRPGGVLIVAHFPNRHSLIERTIERLHLGRGTHEYRYNRSDVEALLDLDEWKMISFELYGLLPRNWLSGLASRLDANSPTLARAYDALDRVLVRLKPGRAQNQAFVAIKEDKVRSA